MPIYDSKGKIISSQKKPSVRELGATGRGRSQIFSINEDEYLSELSFPSDIDVYDKMGRSDSQIGAILLMLSLPIRATQWFIQPKDKSSKAQEIADYVNDCLFGEYGIGLNNGFNEFIKDITTMFQYGHSVFEKVFEVKKGKYKWKKFAIRPQSTIYDIYYDSVGDLEGIDQYKIKENWQTVYIPVTKLLFFSHDMQNGNVRGTSVLRRAYKHWKIKDFLYKITNIGIERNAVGTPVLTLPEGYTEEDKDLADEIVTSLRSSEFGGIRMPDGFILDLFEGKRTLADTLPYINHQDESIARSILAQFMNLGGASSGGGSFALSSDQSEMFLMMLDSSAKNIANVINTHAIPELVNYNFASDLYPKLSFKSMNSTKLINALKTLLDGKLVLPDDDLEGFVRDMLDLPTANPVKSREEMQEQFEQKQLNGPSDNSLNNNSSNNNSNIKEKSKNPIDNNSKQSTYKEKIKKDNINKLSEEELCKLKQIISRQLVALSEKAENMDINSISNIKIQYKGELSKLMGNIITLDENSILNTPKINIMCNDMAEQVKSTFLKKFIDNKEINIKDLTEEIIKIL